MSNPDAFLLLARELVVSMDDYRRRHGKRPAVIELYGSEAAQLDWYANGLPQEFSVCGVFVVKGVSHVDD